MTTLGFIGLKNYLLVLDIAGAYFGDSDNLDAAVGI